MKGGGQPMGGGGGEEPPSSRLQQRASLPNVLASGWRNSINNTDGSMTTDPDTDAESRDRARARQQQERRLEVPTIIVPPFSMLQQQTQVRPQHAQAQAHPVVATASVAAAGAGGAASTVGTTAGAAAAGPGAARVAGTAAGANAGGPVALSPRVGTVPITVSAVVAGGGHITSDEDAEFAAPPRNGGENENMDETGNGSASDALSPARQARRTSRGTATAETAVGWAKDLFYNPDKGPGTELLPAGRGVRKKKSTTSFYLGDMAVGGAVKEEEVRGDCAADDDGAIKERHRRRQLRRISSNDMKYAQKLEQLRGQGVMIRDGQFVITLPQGGTRSVQFTSQLQKLKKTRVGKKQDLAHLRSENEDLYRRYGPCWKGTPKRDYSRAVFEDIMGKMTEERKAKEAALALTRRRLEQQQKALKQQQEQQGRRGKRAGTASSSARNKTKKRS